MAASFLSGRADDAKGPSSGTPGSFYPDKSQTQPDLDAVDGLSSASSGAPTKYSVSGSAHAIPGSHPNDDVLAFASSHNRIRTVFIATSPTVLGRDYKYGFYVGLDLSEVRIIGDGRASILAQLTFVEANGNPILRQDGAPMRIGGDPIEFSKENPPPANGKFREPWFRTGVIEFPDEGEYYLELELNITASAPVTSNGRSSEAHVGRASATISTSVAGT